MCFIAEFLNQRRPSQRLGGRRNAGKSRMLNDRRSVLSPSKTAATQLGRAIQTVVADSRAGRWTTRLDSGPEQSPIVQCVAWFCVECPVTSRFTRLRRRRIHDRCWNRCSYVHRSNHSRFKEPKSRESEPAATQIASRFWWPLSIRGRHCGDRSVRR